MFKKLKKIFKHKKILDKEDVNKLVNIYIKLKEIEAELIEICNKYSYIKELNLIRKDIKILDKIDHDIKNKVYKIQKGK